MLDLTGYKLTFDDEFNARSISQTGAGTTWADIRSQWRLDANSDIGFGRSSFVDPASGYDPFRVADGALTITAVPDRTASGYPGSWESGLITTQNGFSQTYGYFEIRAKFSSQPGAWDAFWLLPVTQLPDPHGAGGWQELDIVEHYGDGPRSVYSTIHTTDQTPNIPWQWNRQVYSEMADATGYHTYGLNWQRDVLSFYVDGQLVGTQATPSDMHGPMYLLANLATQGSGSNNADAAGVALSSAIDYVRVYANDPNAAAVIQGAVSAPDGRDPGLYGATAALAAAAVGQPVSGTATAAAAVTPVSVTSGSVTSASAASQIAPAAASPSTGDTTAASATASAHDAYRFYDTATGDHFYTTSAAERATIRATLPSYRDEGVAWAAPDKGPGTLDVYRFLDTASGTHFLTVDMAERDSIIAHLPALHYEGVAFQSYAAAGAGTVTLERFYNTATGQHHFAPPAEADAIRHGSAGANWTDEGAGLVMHLASAAGS